MLSEKRRALEVVKLYGPVRPQEFIAKLWPLGPDRVVSGSAKDYLRKMERDGLVYGSRGGLGYCLSTKGALILQKLRSEQDKKKNLRSL